VLLWDNLWFFSMLGVAFQCPYVVRIVRTDTDNWPVGVWCWRDCWCWRG